ncbi:MAG: hypothetical protein Q8K89_01725, partial [Actinomycetota bacterium]|nr:hypothetical protein [Actinomycetota bacterium]
ESIAAAKRQSDDSLYVPSLLRPQSSTDATGAIEVASVSEAARRMRFRPMVPTDGTMKAQDVLLAGETADNLGLVVEYGGIRIVQWPHSSQAEAQADVQRNAIPAMGFDDRFMRAVRVRGFEGIAWDAIDVDSVCKPNGELVRAGVSVPYSGVIWSEGSIVYRVMGYSGTPDSKQLLAIAESMKPLEQ